jgi:hypothetical protein
MKITCCTGDVVVSRVDWPVINVKAGDLGIIVDVYVFADNDWGAQIIFRNGGDCGFSKEEIQDLIIQTGMVIPELTTYSFQTSWQLYKDWKHGKFDKAWKLNEPT